MYKNTLLDKLDRKFGRYALKNLMTIIVFGTIAVWLLDTIVYMRAGESIIPYLRFHKQAILEGQVWRVITFVFVPSDTRIFMLALTLYFYWLIGNTLEDEWGSLRFDLYYLCGVLGAIGSGLITGFATAEYLHLSLFLAFAILYPNHQVLIFFFIPIKMKWLALIDVIGLVVLFIFNGWTGRIAMLVALLNIAIFFWRKLFEKLYMFVRRKRWKRQAKRKNEDDYPFDL